MSIDPLFASSVRAYRGIVQGPTSTQKQIFFEKHGQDNGSPNIYVFSHERRVDCDARGGQDTDIDGLAEVDRAGPWLNRVSEDVLREVERREDFPRAQPKRQARAGERRASAIKQRKWHQPRVSRVRGQSVRVPFPTLFLIPFSFSHRPARRTRSSSRSSTSSCALVRP